MGLRGGGAAGLVLVLPLALSACGLLASSSGVNKPQYVLPKSKRILVMVDIDPSVATPPAGLASRLGDGISGQLYKYKAIDNPVSQGRLSELRLDTDKYSKMGVANIAQATGADVVVYVNVITFNTSAPSEGMMTQGNAQVLVKVINADGKRLWPVNNVAGARVDVTAEPVFTETRDVAGTATELTGRLSRDVGRLFREWARNENGMKNE